MAGISSKALKPNYAENKSKFNGGNELQSKEFSDGSGLEMYDARYDQQIGRFNRIEPLADIFNELTPYSYSYNNPINFNDRFGLNPSGFGEEHGGPQAHKGWIRTGSKVYFDPRVHNQDDIKKFGLTGTYIAEEIFIVDDDGNRIGYGNDQGGISYNNNLPAVTVTGKRKFDKLGDKNMFRQTSDYMHWSGDPQIKRYISRLDDGDAIRFFNMLKDDRKKQVGGDVVTFVPMNYWLSTALGGLALLSDKQIEAIMDEYDKTGDKRGIIVKLENVIVSSSGNTWNYSISLNKNDKSIGQISQTVFGAAY